jgi:hypothetical protein
MSKTRRIGIISASKEQKREAGRAEDVFIGKTYIAMKNWIQTRCDEWYTIAPDHPHLLAPGDIIEPNHIDMGRWDAGSHRIWKQRLENSILQQFDFSENIEFILMISDEYSAALREFREWSIDVVKDWVAIRTDYIKLHPWTTQLRGSILRHMLEKQVPAMKPGANGEPPKCLSWEKPRELEAEIIPALKVHRSQITGEKKIPVAGEQLARW